MICWKSQVIGTSCKCMAPATVHLRNYELLNRIPQTYQHVTSTRIKVFVAIFGPNPSCSHLSLAQFIWNLAGSYFVLSLSIAVHICSIVEFRHNEHTSILYVYKKRKQMERKMTAANDVMWTSFTKACICGRLSSICDSYHRENHW